MKVKHGAKRYGNFMKERKNHDESNVWLKYRKRSTYLMFMLGLKETIDQLAMANSVHWHGHVLRRGWSHPKKGIRF